LLGQTLANPEMLGIRPSGRMRAVEFTVSDGEPSAVLAKERFAEVDFGKL
jgi:hypothetical protein